jgi:hypothetical protein
MALELAVADEFRLIAEGIPRAAADEAPDSGR